MSSANDSLIPNIDVQVLLDSGLVLRERCSVRRGGGDRNENVVVPREYRVIQRGVANLLQVTRGQSRDGGGSKDDWFGLQFDSLGAEDRSLNYHIKTLFLSVQPCQQQRLKRTLRLV